MTSDELQKLIEYIDDASVKYLQEYYDETKGEVVHYPAVLLKDVIGLIRKYPVEQPDSEYRTMYENCVESLETSRAEIRDLKRKLGEHELLERDLYLERAQFVGAIAMAEAMLGRKLELTR